MCFVRILHFFVILTAVRITSVSSQLEPSWSSSLYSFMRLCTLCMLLSKLNEDDDDDDDDHDDL